MGEALSQHAGCPFWAQNPVCVTLAPPAICRPGVGQPLSVCGRRRREDFHGLWVPVAGPLLGSPQRELGSNAWADTHPLTRTSQGSRGSASVGHQGRERVLPLQTPRGPSSQVHDRGRHRSPGLAVQVVSWTRAACCRASGQRLSEGRTCSSPFLSFLFHVRGRLVGLWNSSSVFPTSYAT